MKLTSKGVPDRRYKETTPTVSERGRKAALIYTTRQSARKRLKAHQLLCADRAFRLLAESEALIGDKATQLLNMYYGDVRPHSRASHGPE